jgi:stringent starvation protein B
LSKLNSNAYLIKGIYDWCVDSDLTPYIRAELNEDTKLIVTQAITLINRKVDRGIDNSLVLNISYSAVQNIIINDDGVSFKARFNGKFTKLSLSIDSIKAIYSVETGEGIFVNNKGYFEASKDNLFVENLSKKPIKKIKPQLRLV